MPEDGFGLSPRIEELRERYAQDPTSRIFLQLAEEYRKAGMFEEAVKVCQEGLEHHPNYTSARVTLGRAFMGAQKLHEARAEFESVIAAAPDNIMANRSLGDLYFGEGRLAEALERYRVVAMLNPADEEVALRIRDIEGGPSSQAQPAPPPQTARDVFGPKPPPAPEPQAPEVPLPDEGFMDLKIDESVILNADALSQAMKDEQGAEPAPPPAEQPVPPVQHQPPPVAEAEPAEAADSFDAMAEMGMDDFSEFSTPTVMLSADEIQKQMAEAQAQAPEPEPEPRTPPAARSADKYGIPRSTPAEPGPAPPEPTPAPPEEPTPAPEFPELGEVGGMDDYSEFGAPTVMMNVDDLMKEAQKEGKSRIPESEPAAPPGPMEAPASDPLEPTSAPAWGESEGDMFASDAGAFEPPDQDAAESFETVFASEPPAAPPAPASPAPEAPADAPATRSADITSRTLAELYMQQGHLEKALEQYREYAVAHPEDREAVARIQEIEQRLGGGEPEAEPRAPAARAAPETGFTPPAEAPTPPLGTPEVPTPSPGSPVEPAPSPGTVPAAPAPVDSVAEASKPAAAPKPPGEDRPPAEEDAEDERRRKVRRLSNWLSSLRKS